MNELIVVLVALVQLYLRDRGDWVPAPLVAVCLVAVCLVAVCLVAVCLVAV